MLSLLAKGGGLFQGPVKASPNKGKYAYLYVLRWRRLGLGLGWPCWGGIPRTEHLSLSGQVVASIRCKSSNLVQLSFSRGDRQPWSFLLKTKCCVSMLRIWDCRHGACSRLRRYSNSQGDEMKASSYAAYKRFCELENHNAHDASRTASDQMEAAERSLSRAVDKLQAFDQETASIVGQAMSAAEWRLLETQRRLLSVQVEAGHRQLARQRTQVRAARARVLETEQQGKRCDRFGERIAANQRKLSERRSQRELDEIGMRRSVQY